VNALDGKRILIVEDEFLIAMTARDMVEEFGAIVIGPAATVEEALELARKEAIDIALLDLNLHGQSSVVVAEELEARQIPVVFATGYARGHGKDSMGRAVLGKPYTQEKLILQLASALEARVTEP
jgi:CheY-like chemotaxis protein